MLTSVVHAIHNSAQGRGATGRRFQRPIAPFIPAPRNLPRPRWPVRFAGFLIANPRLEIFTSPTKQTIGAKSNRERIAFFPYDSSRHPSAIDFRSEISNRNNRIIRNSPKCRRNNTYAFSNRNKSTYSGIFSGSLPALFKCEKSALSRLSASHPNRLESKRKWQSPLKLFARNQSQAKIS